jgi:energy-coupling factor transport system ATP-binding protein
VPDGQCLAGSAEHDLLVRHQAADPQAVDVDTVDDRPTSAVEARRRRVGHGRAAGLAPGGRDQLRRTARGAAGRVRLVGVVQLDDLDRLVEPRGLRGEAHHQDRADREVRGDQHAGRRVAPSEPGPQDVQPALVEAGGADHGVDAVVDAELEVVHHDVGMGEVDDHLRVRGDEGVDRVVLVDGRHQLEVVGGLDRRAHLGAHLAAGTEHADPDLTALHGVQPSACPSRSPVGPAL